MNFKVSKNINIKSYSILQIFFIFFLVSLICMFYFYTKTEREFRGKIQLRNIDFISFYQIFPDLNSSDFFISLEEFNPNELNYSIYNILQKNELNQKYKYKIIFRDERANNPGGKFELQITESKKENIEENISNIISEANKILINKITEIIEYKIVNNNYDKEKETYESSKIKQLKFYQKQIKELPNLISWNIKDVIITQNLPDKKKFIIIALGLSVFTGLFFSLLFSKFKKGKFKVF